MKEPIPAVNEYLGDDSGKGRAIGDYLLIVRERIWYFIIVFSIIFTSTVLYTVQSTPVYRATAKLRLLRETPKVLPFGDIDNRPIRNAEDFNTQIEVLNSLQMVAIVADRLKKEERQQLMAPYINRLGGEGDLADILSRNRQIVPGMGSLTVRVFYTHPNPNVAAVVANYFADEYINLTVGESIATTMNAVENLRVRAETQKELVERIRTELGEYVEKYDSASLNPEENIHIHQLQQIGSELLEDKRRLDVAQAEWELIEEARAKGEPLLNLPTLSRSLLMNELRLRLSQQEVQLAGMKRRYRDSHPVMIELMNTYNQTRLEMERALAFGVENVRKEYQQAQHNHRQTEARLAKKRKELIEINKLAIRYRTLENDLRINESLYMDMMSRLQAAETNMSLVGAQARIIDRALPPTFPFSPNVMLNLVIGIVLGAVGGAAIVFISAFLDDRVKGVWDVENRIGLPLLGIIPALGRRYSFSQRTQAVASGSHPRIAEAFRDVFSSMCLDETCKRAKVILSTSTATGEGRTFVTTNLATSFADFGERTLIIDADLHTPLIAAAFDLEEGKGLIQCLAGECALEEAIVRNVHPNLDILPTGNSEGRVLTGRLNSPECLELLKKLRTQYDRIFLDTAPLFNSSDVLCLLPHVDGMIYIIRYNMVKGRIVRANLRRLQTSQTPIFGAILSRSSKFIMDYHRGG